MKNRIMNYTEKNTIIHQKTITKGEKDEETNAFL